ncbi:hypothetical protein K503DRAFT_782860 [Rhizopogon vinicolor AM-OR11-026]|uniref:Uncharacterized protein n=1 Tax=Rhizopogon vinicolor AM-OR11-026 TaxID=1314800 RepID=A0A1B7N0W5_9AGAM|nr:hypothetical protein K503DRAFT_782860 [Rhizopogon vinicolor AM-OR11-026]
MHSSLTRIPASAHTSLVFGVHQTLPHLAHCPVPPTLCNIFSRTSSGPGKRYKARYEDLEQSPQGVRITDAVLHSNSGLHALLILPWDYITSLKNKSANEMKLKLTWNPRVAYTSTTMGKESHITFAGFLPEERSFPPVWISSFHSMRVSSLSFAAGGSSGGEVPAPVGSTSSCPPLPLLLFWSAMCNTSLFETRTQKTNLSRLDRLGLGIDLGLNLLD